MSPIFIKLHLPLAILVLMATSCDKKGEPVIVDPPSPRVEQVIYQGAKAAEVREKTVIELLAIKQGVKDMIGNQPEDLSIDRLIKELESLRPKLSMIHRQTAKLPKKDQMVVYGNLAVASNQLEQDLLAVLATSPGNDELAVQIANLREGLSPIPLGSILNRY